MQERLSALRIALGIEWGELARRLGISRSMLGFVRRGNKAPSVRLLHAVAQLERDVHGSHTVATCDQCAVLGRRAADLEQELLDVKARLGSVRKALKHVLLGVAELQDAVK